MANKIDDAIKKIEEKYALTDDASTDNLGAQDEKTIIADAPEATPTTPEVEDKSIEIDAEIKAQETAPAIPDFDWEGEFKQLEALLKAPVTDPEPVKEPEVELPEDLKEVEQADYKELLKMEMQKRIAAEKDARERQATAKHLETINDKTSDKHFTFMEKLKDMEVELRRAKASASPEKIAPIAQSFLLWKESPTPIYKYRFLKSILDLAETET